MCMNPLGFIVVHVVMIICVFLVFACSGVNTMCFLRSALSVSVMESRTLRG